jgi:hypothetical protein
MNPAFVYALRAYLIGAALMSIYLIWSAISGGALERTHSGRDWLMIVLFYTAYVGFWPIPLMIIILGIIGILHIPIEL